MDDLLSPVFWRIAVSHDGRMLEKNYMETRESATAYATLEAIVTRNPVTVTEVRLRSMTRMIAEKCWDSCYEHHAIIFPTDREDDAVLLYLAFA